MAKMDFKKNKLVLTIALLAAAAVIGNTAATVLHKMTLENPIKTPSVTGKIEEQPEILERGDKKVTFINEGEADVFIRAAYSEKWTSGNMILPNPPGVSPKINSDDWVKGDDGWYYYRYVLPGSASGKPEDKRKTSSFIEKVTFGTLDETYKKASYEIHAVMEIVQASDDVIVSQEAVKELFGKNITVPEGWNGNKYTYTVSWPVQ